MIPCVCPQKIHKFDIHSDIYSLAVNTINISRSAIEINSLNQLFFDYSLQQPTYMNLCQLASRWVIDWRLQKWFSNINNMNIVRWHFTSSAVASHCLYRMLPIWRLQLIIIGTFLKRRRDNADSGTLALKKRRISVSKRTNNCLSQLNSEVTANWEGCEDTGGEMEKNGW